MGTAKNPRWCRTSLLFIKNNENRAVRFDRSVKEGQREVAREFRGRPPKGDGIGSSDAMGIGGGGEPDA